MFSIPKKLTAPNFSGLFCLICLFSITGLHISLAEEALSQKPAPLSETQQNVQILADSEYYESLIAHIRKAQTSIDMAMFIFKPNARMNNRPALVIKELAGAVKRGVTVRIILERSGHDENLNRQNESAAQIFKKNGINVLFDSPKTTQHAKVVVIDARHCFVGSHNMTHSALKYNKELSLLINDTVLAKRLIEYMDTIGE